MALTDIYAGTSGDVTASGFNCDIDGWNGTFGAEQTISWRTFASKFLNKKNTGYGGSGSFTGTIQFGAADTQPFPAVTGGVVDPDSFEGVSFTLTAESGCTITFTGNITTTALTRTAADRMTGTFNFDVDGEYSITWATS
jgi:hypothetical protein